ncbi:hypothetical protein [Breznakia pachnodae]|uniref:Asparagine synthetase B (Glutamine-hydrolyzing) n=1 Tax=Breznakia pachnodae TaxID=265178 RepID=A0ABU0E4I3_9FIRM|nr:hypothetical protein [Breznakia pachnodae]MDQ0361598.1 asparagine synthetase B (glutamine-hydrolyzing) [Breznakia pachnodae]
MKNKQIKLMNSAVYSEIKSILDFVKVPSDIMNSDIFDFIKVPNNFERKYVLINRLDKHKNLPRKQKKELKKYNRSIIKNFRL